MRYLNPGRHQSQLRTMFPPLSRLSQGHSCRKPPQAPRISRDGRLKGDYLASTPGPGAFPPRASSPQPTTELGNRLGTTQPSYHLWITYGANMRRKNNIPLAVFLSYHVTTQEICMGYARFNVGISQVKSKQIKLPLMRLLQILQL